ncbi:hypothetical protein [Thermoactinomyces sp. CICC 10523]|uniref:hypothetical protein n=1 Tax=Thermoactinomyces sp. CICC 10523 TaxID=2767428 RepID=UPI0018DC288B|nr:hypothetical protein [Thermoactinomyces sp. CICC 10523]MBH8597013.1 hypothetical protein [Thermoactinomyces sp. CICC 10523]
MKKVLGGLFVFLVAVGLMASPVAASTYDSSFVGMNYGDVYKQTRALYVPAGYHVKNQVDKGNNGSGFEWYLSVGDSNYPFRYGGYSDANFEANVPVGTYRLVLHCETQDCTGSARLTVLN